MADYAPSRYWYAEKDGTPVNKYDTPGETLIKLPSGIQPVSVDSREDIAEIETDTSVLTDNEAELLGVF